jgi:hypothetical protein
MTLAGKKTSSICIFGAGMQSNKFKTHKFRDRKKIQGRMEIRII